MENVCYFSAKIIIWILACGNLTGATILKKISRLSFLRLDLFPHIDVLVRGYVKFQHNCLFLVYTAL
jgi:hypothetical protein